MKRGWVVLVLILLVGGGVAGWLAGGDNFSAGPSVLSRSASGWLAAGEYLRRAGTRIEVLERPLADAALQGDVLVLSFPLQRELSADDLAAVHRFLRPGGTLIYAYSMGFVPSISEELLQTSLGVEFGLDAGRAPLAPNKWREFVSRELEADPAQRLAGHQPVSVRNRQWWPVAPAQGEVLFQAGEGQRVIVWLSVQAGRVLLLPVELFSNAGLARGGNLDLLESLRGSLGEVWLFDEYHHGLTAPEETAVAARDQTSIDLLLLHLAGIYLLAVATLGRRFGPAWRAMPTRSGSAASFLVALGGLHDRMAHHGRAAELMVQRADELDPRLGIRRHLRRRPRVVGAVELVELARRVARLQRRGPGGKKEGLKKIGGMSSHDAD